MSEFDQWDQSSWQDSGQGSGDFGGGGEWGDTPRSSGPVTMGGGGWHWLLTIVAVVTVGLLSMGMAWLTRDVDERPVWLMGLIFMVPAGALMFAAMTVEGATSAMTPGTSRAPQIKIAVAATVATLIVACICDLLYLSKFKKPQPIPSHSEAVSYSVSDRLILICDPTLSMKENGQETKARETVERILNECGDTWEIGMIRGGESVDPAAATESQKEALLALAGKAASEGRMYYSGALEKALGMAEQAGGGKRTRIVFLTDGDHPWTKAGIADLTERCLQAETTVSCIGFGQEIPAEMKEHISGTRGALVSADEWKNILEGFEHKEWDETVASTIIPKDVKLQQDLLRNRDSSAVVISFIMLILEGLSLGVCLSLMLSLRGQFRAQYIISPVMGALAAILLKVVWPTDDMSRWWIYEGISFSLLGIVIMVRNNRPGYRKKSTAAQEEYDHLTDADF